MHTFIHRSRLAVSAEEAFRWHARPGALERLTPPWTRIEVLHREGGIADGRVEFRIYNGPVPVRWVAQHAGAIDGREFRDRQVSGPFPHWEHIHRFHPLTSQQSDLEDRIEYEPPLKSDLADSFFVQPMLERTFAYRHRVTAHDLECHKRLSQPPLHFLISGSNGLVGKALCSFLTTGGHRVTRLVREKTDSDDAVRWVPRSGELDASRLEPVDVVVHLAGESIAARRWNESTKQEILRSRSDSTRRLCESLAALQPQPPALICASAIGYYGNRGDELLDEGSALGSGFLAEVCRQWEAATQPARDAGMRVVNLRIGIVLTPAGGALAKLLPPFRLGLGGRVGDGKQYMSWIAIDDLIAAILHCARDRNLQGPVNAVAPHPVSNAELTRTLGELLHRPTLLPIPAAAARLAFGEMADEMLLAGARVQPKRLQDSGFGFWLPDLRSALTHLLGA